jgi:tetratricopeptide (TPR) repeat protein
MAINRLVIWTLLCAGAPAWSHEAASSSSCQAAAAQPAIANAKASLERNPADLGVRFSLADAWSDAGCFNDAVQVLQGAQDQHPGNKELETRLRVARSLVGEEVYFEKLDRADAEAKLKRDAFRCSTLSDLDACAEAARIRPDDAALLVAHADALVRAKRPAEAIGRYRRAAALAPDQPEIAAKISAAEDQLQALQASGAPAGSSSNGATAPRKAASEIRPHVRVARAAGGVTAVHQYSNAEPVARSH